MEASTSPSPRVKKVASSATAGAAASPDAPAPLKKKKSSAAVTSPAEPAAAPTPVPPKKKSARALSTPPAVPATDAAASAAAAPVASGKKKSTRALSQSPAESTAEQSGSDAAPPPPAPPPGKVKKAASSRHVASPTAAAGAGAGAASPAHASVPVSGGGDSTTSAAQATSLYEACARALRDIDAVESRRTWRYSVLVERQPLAEGQGVAARHVVLGLPAEDVPAPVAAAAPSPAPAPAAAGGKAAAAGGKSSLPASAPANAPPPVACVIALRPTQFTIVEAAVDNAPADSLARVDWAVTLQPLEDIFNLNIEYTCADFADVRRLVEAMNPVISKLSFFGESPRVLPMLRALADNYAKLLAPLEAAREALRDEVSRVADIAAKLDAANELLREAAAMGVGFYRGEAPAFTCPACRRLGCPTAVCSCGADNAALRCTTD